MKGTNTRGELGIGSVGRTLAEARRNDLAAFDRLPQEVRSVVAQNIINLNSVSVLRYLDSVERQIGIGATRATVRKLLELEAGEVTVFAGKHLARHGYPLPHVAARASIVRYGSRQPRRRHAMINGFGLAEEVA